MESPNLLKRKLFAVLKAAIWGAAIFDAMIVVTNLGYAMCVNWGKQAT
jgi:hypothetical protein